MKTVAFRPDDITIKIEMILTPVRLFLSYFVGMSRGLYDLHLDYKKKGEKFFSMEAFHRGLLAFVAFETILNYVDAYEQ